MTAIRFDVVGRSYEVSHRIYMENLVRDLDTKVSDAVVKALADKMANKIMEESGPLVMKAFNVEAILDGCRNHLIEKIVTDFLHGKGK